MAMLPITACHYLGDQKSLAIARCAARYHPNLKHTWEANSLPPSGQDAAFSSARGDNPPARYPGRAS